VQVLARGQVETDLIKGARSGDAEAFGELVRRYQARIYTLSLRVLGEHDKAEAVAHETLVDVYQNAAHLETPLDSYLYRLVLDRCDLAARDSGAEPRDLEADPDTETDGEDKGAQLQTALNGLSLTFRVAVVLRDVIELDYTQVAEIMDLPIGTVKSRVHRARLDMSAALTMATRMSPEGD